MPAHLRVFIASDRLPRAPLRIAWHRPEAKTRAAAGAGLALQHGARVGVYHMTFFPSFHIHKFEVHRLCGCFCPDVKSDFNLWILRCCHA